MRLDTEMEVEIGGSLEGVIEAGFVDDEIESFSPLRTIHGIDGRTNDSTIAGPVINAVGGFDRAKFADGIDDVFRKGGKIVGIQFVNVKAVGFPIFVENQGEIEERLLVEPRNVGSDLSRSEVAIVAIQIDPVNVLAGIEVKAGGIDAGDEPEIGVRPTVILEELENGEGAGGFVAVDAGGDVEIFFCAGVCAAVTAQGDAIVIEEGVGFPTVGLGETVGFALSMRDINRLAVIPALVPSQPLHQTMTGSVSR